MCLVCHQCSVRYFLPRKYIYEEPGIYEVVFGQWKVTIIYITVSSVVFLLPVWHPWHLRECSRSAIWGAIAVPMAVSAAWVLPAVFFWGALGNASSFSLFHRIEKKPRCAYCTVGCSYEVSHLPNVWGRPITFIFLLYFFLLTLTIGICILCQKNLLHLQALMNKGWTFSMFSQLFFVPLVILSLL